MEKMQEKVEITLLSNNEKDYIMALDINGEYYSRDDNEDLNYFLARVTKAHYEKTEVNIFPYFKEEKYENIYSQRHSAYMLEKRRAEKEAEKKRNKRKSFAAKAAAVVVGVGLLGSVGCSKVDKNNEVAKEELAKAQTEQSAEIKDLGNKSKEQLIDMLNEKSGQKEAIQKILDTKDYFNVQAAPSIIDSDDAQLYLTADETAAAYMYANILTLGPTQMNKIFGQSDLVWINKAKDGEEPIYELATPEHITNLFDEAREVLANYYSKATEPSGISNIFENEDEQAFFMEFEDLVLEYNKTQDEDLKKQIQAVLKSIFASNDVDALYEKYPGASAFIARFMAPALLSNDVICEDGYANIQAGYRCEIKDEIEASLKQMYLGTQCLEKTKNSYVVGRLIEISNLDIVGINRNISNPIVIPSDCLNNCGPKQQCDEPKEQKVCEELTKEEKQYVEKYKKSYKKKQKENKGCKYYKVKKVVIPKAKDKFVPKKETKKVTTHESVVTKDRSVVEKKFSEEEIKKEEQKAKEKCEEEIKEKNKKEEERAKQLIEENEKAQDEKVKQQMDEYNKTHPEKWTVPANENNSTNNSGNSNTNSGNSNNSGSGNSQSTPSTQSSPAPKTEVVKETYYDNDGNEVTPTSLVKKVKSIMVNGKEYLVKEKITANNSVRVRS